VTAEEITTTVSFTGLNFRNPLLLASGVMSSTAASLRRAFHMGAGGVVTKSLGMKAREGHPNPTVVEVEHGLINAIGLANPGIEEWSVEMRSLLPIGIPVLMSIFGQSEPEFATLAEAAEEQGASGVELNFSCPHAKGYGMDISQDLHLVDEIIRGTRARVNIPIFVKIGAHTSKLSELAETIERAGASGIVAINTLKGMKIDVWSGLPVLGNKVGGYSGPAIKPVGVRTVFELKQCVNIPIIGVGGIQHGTDAIEYMMAGASAVQIGSALHYRGISAFEMILDEMKEHMAAIGIDSAVKLIGAAHKGGIT